jgi:hypothetical protein
MPTGPIRNCQNELLRSDRCFCNRNNVYVGAIFITTPLKEYGTFNQGKQGVIFPDSNVVTRMMPGAPLPDEDIAGFGNLSTEQFYTQSFAYGNYRLLFYVPFLYIY